MSLAEISIRKPVFAWILMFGLIFFGFLAFRKLGVSSMPDVDFPVVNVQLTLTGASPEVMETNVVDTVEDALLSVEGIKQITSTSTYGQANITVELDLSRNVDAALQEVQTRVAQAQRALPTALDPPIVTKFNPEDQPIMFVAVSCDCATRDLMLYVRDRLKNRFSLVQGVGTINLGGFVDRNLRIWANGPKLSRNELTVDDIIGAVNREHLEQPAGLIETPIKQMNVRSMGEAPTAKEFAELPILARGGQPIFDTLIRIRDVARVEDGLDDVKRISRYLGKPAVGMGIIKTRGTNAVEVAEAVRKQMDALQSQMPPGYKMAVAFDSTKFIKESIADLEFTLLLSALLTSFVCWIFLGNWSSTVNILLAIPTSVMGTFIVLYLAGFTLNTFTLLALSLAIGIVVDDAIMVLENIVRHRQLGESLVQGAMIGAKEITFAAIATTMSICAIFAPVLFMSGIIGKFFFQFGVCISAAVLLSLLEALTLTPMRCSQFLNVEQGFIGRKMDQQFHKLAQFYKRILTWCLEAPGPQVGKKKFIETLRRMRKDHRLRVIGASILFFAGTFGVVSLLKKEFVPAQDQSQFIIRIQTPVGSSLKFTDDVTKKCEEELAKRGELLRYFVAVGGFGSGGQGNLANVFVTMKDLPDRPIDPQLKRRLSQEQSGDAVRKILSKIPGVTRVTVQDLSMRGFSSSRGFPVEITIRGPDWEVLTGKSAELMDAMRKSDKYKDVDTNFLEGQQEAQIYPDRRAAASFGVSIGSVGDVLGAMVGGAKIGQFTEGGHRYDIRVRVDEAERQSTKDVKNIFVRNNRGELISLASVTRVEERASLQSITRLNRERAVTVMANPGAKYGAGQVTEEAVQMARKIFPAGYSAEASGSSQTMAESFSSLGIALVLGIVVAYMILASQFNSFIHPVTVLIALPFSFSGAILALYLTGQSLNMYSFIALLLLMGLVKKNSIMLVDFTNRVRTEGKSVRDALLEACPVRLRPILMTSIATIAAAIPPAISFGPGGETRIPMAVAVIGGTLVSTLLTLVVVPCVYSLFKKLERMPPESLGH